MESKNQHWDFQFRKEIHHQASKVSELKLMTTGMIKIVLSCDFHMDLPQSIPIVFKSPQFALLEVIVENTLVSYFFNCGLGNDTQTFERYMSPEAPLLCVIGEIFCRINLLK